MNGSSVRQGAQRARGPLLRRVHVPRRVRASRIAYGVGDLPARLKKVVATIGVFDGVHRAHQELIGRAVALARQRNGTSVVITFDPDPQAVLLPSRAPSALMSLRERCERIADLGADWILVIPFDRRLARVPARVFVTRVLRRRLAATALIIGSDFMFGRGAAGDVALLRRMGAETGMAVEALPRIRLSGGSVSSSRIRRLIAEGRLASARRLLGRFPTLEGDVVHGAARGRRLKMPTANVALLPRVLPPNGVYAVWAAFGRRRCKGVMNLGVRPTFGGGPLVCEVHLFGFSGALYGRRVRLSLVSRLRRERCFAGIAALKAQMARDARRARLILSRSR